ncbi:hypothetical protein [Hymenobacter volaticus]|uniref:STAS/SEC14 domain-containing protein n=1 Tax=Hymenobacter volaticus TaxID=2932254 RepID=A0ABY4G5W9_9BACT|nr:hypothetical protein [Hymenobacter volaticus]UOQ66299.1 hypothetical protein MUN86_22900 [Hymenobacter volaticus]
MTLFHTPDASLIYNSASDILCLSYSATRLSISFRTAYQKALEKMLKHNVTKLLLDLKRNAPPTDETEHILHPLTEILLPHPDRSLFIAAVVSEKQYQYQIGNILASSSATLPPAKVEFNYFTSRREATDWLNSN